LRTLTKYVLKKSLKPFFMGLGGFIIFVSVEWLYQISDYIIRNRVDISKLLLFVVYNLPYFTVLGIPVGVLFAIFWVISEMSTNREITAVLVHGISSKRLVTPFVVFSVVLSIFAWLLNDYVVPNANYKSSQVLNQYILQSPETVVKTNMLVELEKDVYFYVKQYDKQKGELYDVVLFKNEENNEQILTAEKVLKKKDGWYLLNGNMYVVDLDSGFLNLDMQFKTMKLDVASEIEQMLRAYKTTRDKTSKEIREQLETYKKLGINTASLTVELHQRYANALGSLVIVLLGLPLSLLFGFASRSWSVILTFIIVVLYQGSGAWLSGMGKEGLLDPVLATWLPNIVFSLVGFIMYILLDTPIAYRVREVLSRILSFALIVTILIFISNSSLFAADIKIKANEAFISETYLKLRENVTFLWDNYKLECEEATATIESGSIKSITAGGNVTLLDGERKYVAKSLTYEFENKRFFVLNVKTVYNYDYKGKKVPIYLSGSAIELNTEDSGTSKPSEIVISNSQLTTCNLDTPHYVIVSDHVYVLENKYIIAKNSFLVILGVPVFPYPVFITGLEGASPYSFTMVFSKSLNVVHSFSFAINDWNVKLSLGTDSTTFEALDSKNKNQKFIYDSKNDRFEFSLYPLTYRYNKNTIYYKYDGLLYLEGNYTNDSNYYQKLGLAIQDPKSFAYFSPYIMYDGRLSDTIIYLSGGLKNFVFDFFNGNILTGNADSTFKLQTDGYVNSIEKSWSPTYQTRYNFNLSNNNLKYNLLFSGNVTNNAENRLFNYVYQLPFSWKYDLFSTTFNYTFNIKGVSNITPSSSSSSVGMTDKYVLETNYNVGPFKISGIWEQVYSFLDEPESSSKNSLKLTANINSSNLTLNLVRGFDFLTGKTLQDVYNLKYTNQVGNINFTGSLSTTYDNTQKKLGAENVLFNIGLKDVNTNYTLQFTILPGNPVLTYIHTLKYSNLSTTIYQENDFIKRALISGSFDMFDYSAKVSANYSVASKVAEPNWSLSYTMERKDEKYAFSYNTDNRKTYILEASSKVIDPNILLKVRYNPSNSTFESISLTLDKSLHCWHLLFGLDLSQKQTTNIFDFIDKVTVKFYLTDIQDIYFFFDPKAGQFQFSGM